jgi:protein-L-isoaspartate(D-aspartate) O-methyltransferase
MVDTQVRPSDVTSLPIINAMLSVPREVFLPAERAETAYVGENIALSPGRVMLAPRTFAKMVESLSVTPDDTALVVGAGHGYSAAVLSRVTKRVVALEEDPALVIAAEKALGGFGAELVSGPLTLGAKGSGPYDVIFIEGAVEVLPEALSDQLNDTGRIVALFRDGALGMCRLGLKSGGRVDWRPVFAASAPVLPGFERAKHFAL